jgi:glycosyltransferase 2 family protein
MGTVPALWKTSAFALRTLRLCAKRTPEDLRAQTQSTQRGMSRERVFYEAGDRPFFHTVRYNAKSMRAWLRKSWPLLKALLALAILIAIGRQFVRDLSRPELWQQRLHPGWLALSAVLYLCGLGFSAVYWYRLLVALGQGPSFLGTVRAHYIGQMGKYLPGKAWALFLRSNLIRSPTTHVGVAVLTSFYEVFITMSSGALLAALLFGVQAWGSDSPVDWHVFGRIWKILQAGEAEATPVDARELCLLALLLTLAIGIPSVPPIFNRLVQRLTLPFRQADTGPVPTPRTACMLQGLVLTPGCWLLMGASLWAALHAAGVGPAWGWDKWSHYTAFIALAYVSGFVIVFLPSGLGAREAMLVLLLVPDISQRLGLVAEDARPLATLTVVLLRLVWTAAEVAIVAVLYWLPVGVRHSAKQGTVPL